jgi:ubiquinone/menaquinone biosynthesis C-methylase UbiE
MPEVNASFVGSIPETYDRHLGPVIFEPYADDLTRRLSTPPRGDVLEVACGTGILTERLRRALPAATRLVATDLNQPMIDYARGRLGALPGVEWQTADAAALPFPDASFGAVACQFGVMFVPDKGAAFREARRVLPRGGVFAFNVWDSLEQNPFGAIAHRTITGFFESDPPTFYLTPFGFYDVDTLKGHLAANDFGRVNVEKVTLENRSATARSFATGLVLGNPVVMAIQERGLKSEPIIDAVEATLVRAGGDKPFRSRMQAVVVTATAGA